ncbi:MAG: hypothetical protein ACYS99_23480, partial [Planctomycetota bacterium]
MRANGRAIVRSIMILPTLTLVVLVASCGEREEASGAKQDAASQGESDEPAGERAGPSAEAAVPADVSSGAAEGEAIPPYLRRYFRLRGELIEAARPLDRVHLAWHRAKDEESASKVFEECHPTAQKFMPIVEAQAKALEAADVPAACQALHKAHLRSLELGAYGVRRFLDEANKGGWPARNVSVFCPTGLPEQQRRLHEELGKLLGRDQTEAERKAEERITQEIARSRKIDRPLRDACGLWQKA